MRGYIRKRKHVYQICAYIPDPATGEKKPYWEGGFKDKNEAEKRLNEILVASEQNSFFDPGKMTVKEYLEQWLELKDELTPSTFKRYKGIIEQHLNPLLGGVQLKHLNPLQIEHAFKKMKHDRKSKKDKDKELSPTTLLQHYRVLHAALQDAVKKSLIADNPCERVNPPKKIKKKQKALTLQQIKTLLGALEGTSLWLPTFLSLQTGMRLGEILGLKWENINFDEETIEVAGNLYYTNKKKGWSIGLPKNKETRTVAVNHDVVRALKEHKRKQAQLRLSAGQLWNDYGFVITNDIGEPLMITSVSSRFRRLARKAGINTHFHILRHTHVTLACRTGVDLRNIADRTGHSITLMLDTYAHSDYEAQRIIAEKVGEMLR